MHGTSKGLVILNTIFSKGEKTKRGLLNIMIEKKKEKSMEELRWLWPTGGYLFLSLSTSKVNIFPFILIVLFCLFGFFLLSFLGVYFCLCFHQLFFSLKTEIFEGWCCCVHAKGQKNLVAPFPGASVKCG